MRSKLLLILFVAFLAFTSSAQTAQVANPDVVEQNLRRHIEYLASDKLEGRRTGEQGAALASKYIADEFAKLKLKPGYTGSGKASYLQPFPYVTGVELAKTGNEFSLEVIDANGQRTKAGDIVARPVAFSPNASISNASVVFAGYGIVAKEANRNDYSGIDVKGKVVLIFDGSPENDNPHSPFVRFDARTKALIAKDKGAVGVLLISREDKLENDRLTRLGFDQTLGEAALPTFIVSQNVHSLSQQGLSVNFKIDLVKKTVNSFNVIGILPGTDPVLKNEAIIVGAHYDHLGRGGQGSLAANSTEVHHGADDNASGTAAVLELARQFATAKNNKRTLIFMCFSGEEEGLLGSNYYVNNPVFTLDKTVAMMNMDMIGRLKDYKLTVGGIGTAAEWNELVKRNNDILFDSENGYGVGGKFVLQLSEDGFGPSDHSSFYSKKIPVLFFFTGTHNEYHKPTDTADKINYDGESKVVSYVSAIAKAVDQNPQRPSYTVAKSTPISGGRTGFNISLGTIPNYADATDGLLLDGVRDDSPAAKAGLKAGDKVIKLAGKDIRNVMDYTYVLGEMKAGEEYEVIVLRGGEKITMKIIPVKR